MYVSNKKGLTLIELLATLTISFIIVGLVSSVLFQSFRNLETSDRYSNLRQEANLIISVLSNAHINSTCEGNNGERNCTINFDFVTIPGSGEWSLQIGEHLIQSSTYHITLEIISIETTHPPYILNTSNPSEPIPDQIQFKNNLYIKELKLTDIANPDVFFETTTIISRL